MLHGINLMTMKLKNIDLDDFEYVPKKEKIKSRKGKKIKQHKDDFLN